jgi:phosphoenolpyruvate carboxylase
MRKHPIGCLCGQYPGYPVHHCPVFTRGRDHGRPTRRPPTAKPTGNPPWGTIRPVTDPQLDPHVSEPTGDARLRSHIRLLGDLLGRTLVRQEGQDLLDQVEAVRLAVRNDPQEAARLLDSADLDAATKLARSFSIYFDLANVAEQVERAHDAGADGAARSGPLHRVVDAAREAGVDRELGGTGGLGDVGAPGFHRPPDRGGPTLGLVKLRRIADILLDTDASNADRARSLAEVIDLLWQTDELRFERPQVLDEARNALYYLDDLTRGPLGKVLEDLAASFAELGVELPADARPVSFGSWIGGDRDGNPFVTPQVTTDVVRFQRDHAVLDLLPHIDRLLEDLSISERLAGASPTTRIGRMPTWRTCPTWIRGSCASTPRSRCD